MDEKERWNKELIQKIRGTPQQPNPNRPGLTIPVSVSMDMPEFAEPVPVPEHEEDEDKRQIRRMKITGTILQKYGYTDGCEGCKWKKAGMREARPHSEKCRIRVEKAMDEDEEDKKKRQDVEDRINFRLATKMEKILKQKEDDKKQEQHEPQPEQGEQQLADPEMADEAREEDPEEAVDMAPERKRRPSNRRDSFKTYCQSGGKRTKKEKQREKEKQKV